MNLDGFLNNDSTKMVSNCVGFFVDFEWKRSGTGIQGYDLGLNKVVVICTCYQLRWRFHVFFFGLIGFADSFLVAKWHL